MVIIPTIRTFEKEYVIDENYFVNLQDIRVYALTTDGFISEEVDYIITSIKGKLTLCPISNKEKYCVLYQRCCEDSAFSLKSTRDYFPKNITIKFS